MIMISIIIIIFKIVVVPVRGVGVTKVCRTSYPS